MGIRPFSWGQFGRIPDPPEIDCYEEFDEDDCIDCPNYEECKQIYEDEV